MPSNFDFIPDEAKWDALREEVLRAERRIYEDPASSCLKSRKAVEFVVSYIYEHELRIQNKGSLFENVEAREFESWVKSRDAVLYGAFHQIRQSGNEGAHYREKEIGESEALKTVRALHRVMWWFIQRYAPAYAVGEKPSFENPEARESADDQKRNGQNRDERVQELKKWSSSRLANVVKSGSDSSVDVEMATAILLNRIEKLNNDLVALLL